MIEHIVKILYFSLRPFSFAHSFGHLSTWQNQSVKLRRAYFVTRTLLGGYKARQDLKQCQNDTTPKEFEEGFKKALKSRHWVMILKSCLVAMKKCLEGGVSCSGVLSKDQMDYILMMMPAKCDAQIGPAMPAAMPAYFGGGKKWME